MTRRTELHLCCRLSERGVVAEAGVDILVEMSGAAFVERPIGEFAATGASARQMDRRRGKEQEQCAGKNTRAPHTTRGNG